MPFDYSDNYCFACGKANPIGLKLDVKVDRENKEAHTVFVPRKEFEGYNGYLHGGIIATLLDEVMVYAAHTVREPAVTAEMTVRYKKPVPIGEKLEIQGRVTLHRGRFIKTEGVLKSQKGEILATATASYFAIEPKN